MTNVEDYQQPMTPTDDKSPVTKRDVVEQKFDKIFPQPPRGDIVEGVFAPQSFSVMLDFAKAMATSSQLGVHLRGNVGDCLMMVSMAVHHKLEPYSLALMSYGVNNRIQFEAKFATALINTSGLLKQRLAYEFAGEGQGRTCSVSGTFFGHNVPQVYTSPPLSQITPKKSPLWDSDPDQQLSYYAARAWGRRYASDVLAGFHFEGDEPESVVDLKPNKDAPEAAGLHDRLAFSAAQQDEREPFVGIVAGDTPRPPPGVTQPAEDRVAAPAAADVPAGKGKRASKAASHKPYLGTPTKSTPEAYRKHVAAWLRDYDTEEGIEARWKSERRMRNQCGVTEEDRIKVRVLIDARIANIRN